MNNPLFSCEKLSVQPSYKPLFQNLPVQGTPQFPAMQESHGMVEDDYLVTDINESEAILTLTRADEFYRDQAEAGYPQGQGTYIDGYWEHAYEPLRFNLNTCWSPCGCQPCFPYGEFAPLCGQPCIEIPNNFGGFFYKNGTAEWNTLWQFVRMTTGVIPGAIACEHLGGATQNEYTHATILVQKNGLNGCWGGKNRISENSKWREDKTLLNHVIDPGWTRERIADSTGTPVHNFIWREWNNAAVILPEMILHRPGFDPRRVFMAPEGVHYPICRGDGISGIVYVTLSLPNGRWISKDLTLCFPGGANAVGVCDLTLVRRAEKVILRILSKQGVEGWKFAMFFAARLRKEHIDFSVNLLTGNHCQELNLKNFRKALVDQSLVVPAELSDDFEGNLITFIESKHPDLIPGVLPKGALMLVSEKFFLEVAFCLATSVRHGCWDGRWQSVKRNYQVTLFADKYGFSRLKKTKIPTGVNIRSGNIALEKAKELVRNSGLVIFASKDMHNDKTQYHALVRFCLEQEISVIVFTDTPDPFVQQFAYSHFSLTCQRNGLNTEYCFGSAEVQFGVKFTLNDEWQLASCRDLSDTELNQLCKQQNTLQVANGTEEIQAVSKSQIIGTLFDSDKTLF